MKFNNKLEARLFLKQKSETGSSLDAIELQAVLEFFTHEELEDMSFVEHNVSDCFKNPPAGE